MVGIWRVFVIVNLFINCFLLNCHKYSSSCSSVPFCIVVKYPGVAEVVPPSHLQDTITIVGQIIAWITTSLHLLMFLQASCEFSKYRI